MFIPDALVCLKGRGQPEIGDTCCQVALDQDIGRLEVAVRNGRLPVRVMQERQPRQHGRHHAFRLVRSDRPALEQVHQRAHGVVLCHEEHARLGGPMARQHEAEHVGIGIGHEEFVVNVDLVLPRGHLGGGSDFHRDNDLQVRGNGKYDLMTQKNCGTPQKKLWNHPTF